MEENNETKPPPYDMYGRTNPTYNGPDSGNFSQPQGTSVPPPQQMNYAGQQPIYQQPVATPMYVTTARPVGSSVHYVAGLNTVPIMVSHGIALGPTPCNIPCPQCQTNVTTFVKREPGLLAWLSCGVLALFGCVLGCCLIPFCVDECQDAHHFCPNCKTYFGKYSRMR